MQNSKEIAELSDHVLLLLRQKRLTLKTSFEYDILSSHAQTLQILGKHKSLAVGEVRSKLGLSFGSTTKIIDSLEQKKLVDRKKFIKSDLRSTEVFLTSKGRKITQEIESEFASRLQEDLAELPSESRKVLLEGIKILLRQFFDDQRQVSAKPKKPSLGRLIKRSLETDEH